MKAWARKQTGFTIVELLIVVVVIAILAAITIVAYNGIQQRTKNAAIIDAASKSLRMIQAYIAEKGTYPYTVDNDFVCITTDTTCRRNSGPQGVTPAFTTEINTVGTLPKSAPLVSDIRGGVMYQYISTRTVDGVSSPAVLSFYINGINADCGMKVLNSEGTPALTSTNTYTVGNVGSSGATQCVVRIPGPAV